MRTIAILPALACAALACVIVNPEGATFITATVELGGFGRECYAVDSCSLEVTG